MVQSCPCSKSLWITNYTIPRKKQNKNNYLKKKKLYHIFNIHLTHTHTLKSHEFVLLHYRAKVWIPRWCLFLMILHYRTKLKTLNYKTSGICKVCTVLDVLDFKL